MISAERLGSLFALVGPGGVGKNALLNEVVARVDNLRQLPTATTRPMRPGEQQGREHLFVSVAEFQRMIDADELLEHQEVHPGKFYGVPRATVDKAIAACEDLIADIEMYGAAIIRAAYPRNSLAIFIAPPSVESLIERLQTRQASQKDIQDRLSRFPKEMLFAPECDYLIVNDDVDAAVDELEHIILSTRGEWSGEPPETCAVTYKVELTMMRGGEVLCHDDAQSLVVPIHFGDNVETTVLKHFKAIGLPTLDTPRYESVAGTLPLSIDFDGDAYAITYYYVCHLQAHVDAPDGWHWQKRDIIPTGEATT